ncbi:MAG: hypothetical protein SRB2_02912 [Desulfobacteraceae bacterium Eth-SRB2]|nr:MAG: hypothetical protein SRB2_02912 [Desulfobacteraceae bacterium Eth-SRB2]
MDSLPELLFELKNNMIFVFMLMLLYGGYFILANNLESDARVYDCLHNVDSIVIDPHSTGCSPAVAAAYSIKIPVSVSFTNMILHIPISHPLNYIWVKN